MCVRCWLRADRACAWPPENPCVFIKHAYSMVQALLQKIGPSPRAAASQRFVRSTSPTRHTVQTSFAVQEELDPENLSIFATVTSASDHALPSQSPHFEPHVRAKTVNFVPNSVPALKVPIARNSSFIFKTVNFVPPRRYRRRSVKHAAQLHHSYPSPSNSLPLRPCP
jgi:hypothetical protein